MESNLEVTKAEKLRLKKGQKQGDKNAKTQLTMIVVRNVLNVFFEEQHFFLKTYDSIEFDILYVSTVILLCMHGFGNSK